MEFATDGQGGAHRADAQLGQRSDPVRTFVFIEAKKANFPIEFMCCRLGVYKSGYYAWLDRPVSKGPLLMPS